MSSLQHPLCLYLAPTSKSLPFAEASALACDSSCATVWMDKGSLTGLSRQSLFNHLDDTVSFSPSRRLCMQGPADNTGRSDSETAPTPSVDVRTSSDLYSIASGCGCVANPEVSVMNGRS